jgi:hypothetical protein
LAWIAVLLLIGQEAWAKCAPPGILFCQAARSEVVFVGRVVEAYPKSERHAISLWRTKLLGPRASKQWPPQWRFILATFSRRERPISSSPFETGRRVYSQPVDATDLQADTQPALRSRVSLCLNHENSPSHRNPATLICFTDPVHPNSSRMPRFRTSRSSELGWMPSSFAAPL